MAWNPHLAAEPAVGRLHDVHDVGARCARAGAARTPGRPRSHSPQRPRQYLSIRYSERLAEVGIEASVGHVPPAEYELEYHRLNEAPAMAA